MTFGGVQSEEVLPRRVPDAVVSGPAARGAVVVSKRLSQIGIGVTYIALVRRRMELGVGSQCVRDSGVVAGYWHGGEGEARGGSGGVSSQLAMDAALPQQPHDSGRKHGRNGDGLGCCGRGCGEAAQRGQARRGSNAGAVVAGKRRNTVCSSRS